MKVEDATVITCSPGRNYVTLQLTGGGGTVGLGDATLNGRELAVVSYLQDHVLPTIIGRTATNIEELWQFLYRGSYWRGGPVTMTAIGAVDMALWDLKAKWLGVPLYELLGGRSRECLRAYGHAWGRDPAAAMQAADDMVAAGFSAVRVQCGLPSLPFAFGPAQGNDSSLPREEQWSTDEYLALIPGLFLSLRDRYGPQVSLLHDVHHRLTPTEAAWLGQRLEPARMYWMEDPVPAERQESYRAIRQRTTTPIAVGEVLNSVYDCQQLIEQELIDFIRMAPAHGGGLTALKKVAALAEVHHVQLACHGPSDLSPISLAAAIHCGTAVWNTAIQEYVPHPAESAAVFRTSHRLEKGYFVAGDTPGLGVEFNEKAAQRYPYKRAYLPVLRRPDGSVADW